MGKTLNCELFVTLYILELSDVVLKLFTERIGYLDVIAFPKLVSAAAPNI